ncbi:hypothetical protein TNCV_4520671 [Trichonephila clavipes]|nr:hypothetical protein TNCV_4520671 [Trichonephila clavipes]
MKVLGSDIWAVERVFQSLKAEPIDCCGRSIKSHNREELHAAPKPGFLALWSNVISRRTTHFYVCRESSVTEYIRAPLQNQILGPKPDLTKGMRLKSVRLWAP